MKRILVLNNYSIERVLQEINDEKKPSHHLYGIVELQRLGYEIITIETNKQSIVYLIGQLFSKIPLCNLGDWYIQFKALKVQSQYDLVYAPCQDVTLLLGLFSYFKLFNKPIIALAHHPFLKGRFKQFRKVSLFFSIRGHFCFPSLSTIVSDQVNQIARKEISKTLHWGPDLMFYENEMKRYDSENIKYDLIAIGRTGRDYTTFVRAFSNTSIRVGLFCNKVFQKSIGSYISSNIDIHYLDFDEELNYKEIISLYCQSKIIAIPLTDDDSLCGLTSICDALGCGLPVLMTHNRYVDLNPTKLQFGETVPYADIQSWINMTEKILKNYEHNYKQSIKKVSEKFNIEVFTKELDSLFNSIK